VVERDRHVGGLCERGRVPGPSLLRRSGASTRCMSIATAEGLGLAGATLDGLVQACAKQGFWKLVSRIFPENTASLAPHERAGFRVVGTYVERLLEAVLGD